VSSSAAGQGFTADIPLQDVPPGTYALRVDATSAISGYAEHRTLPFEVK